MKSRSGNSGKRLPNSEMVAHGEEEEEQKEGGEDRLPHHQQGQAAAQLAEH